MTRLEPSKGALRAGRAMEGYSFFAEQMAAIIDRETKAPEMAELLRSGKQLVEGSVTHRTHGGPTITDAMEWIKSVERLLTELEGGGG